MLEMANDDWNKESWIIYVHFQKPSLTWSNEAAVSLMMSVLLIKHWVWFRSSALGGRLWDCFSFSYWLLPLLMPKSSCEVFLSSSCLAPASASLTTTDQCYLHTVHRDCCLTSSTSLSITTLNLTPHHRLSVLIPVLHHPHIRLRHSDLLTQYHRLPPLIQRHSEAPSLYSSTLTLKVNFTSLVVFLSMKPHRCSLTVASAFTALSHIFIYGSSTSLLWSTCLIWPTFHTGCPSWHKPLHLSGLGSSTVSTQEIVYLL